MIRGEGKREGGKGGFHHAGYGWNGAEGNGPDDGRGKRMVQPLFFRPGSPDEGVSFLPAFWSGKGVWFYRVFHSMALWGRWPRRTAPGMGIWRIWLAYLGLCRTGSSILSS